MLAIALTLTLALSACVAAAVLALRGRRRRRAPALSAPRDARPAGVRHLAKSLSDLSGDPALRMAARRASLAGKPRLGALLDLRS